MRLREIVEKFWREWVPLDEITRLPAETRVALFGLVSWSGVALAALLTGLLCIEIAARNVAPLAAKEIGATRQRSNDEAILQRPVFSRTRLAALPAVARPQALTPPPLAAPPVLAARDSDLRLKGVFMNAPMAKAFLISAQNPGGAWVKPEEVFGGWKLVSVRPSDIELEGGGERLTVTLSAGSPGKAGSPANTSSPGYAKNTVQNVRPSPQFRP